MHFVDNPALLSLWIADDETTEHFISLLGFSNRNTPLGLDDFLVFGKHLFKTCFLASVSSSGNSKSGFISFLASTKAWMALLTSVFIPFCSMMRRTAMMWMRYSSLFPYLKATIWKLLLPSILTLICSVSCFLSRSKGRTYGIGGQAINFPFLHLALLRPSGRDFRLELMAYCQSGVSRIRHLNDNLDGTRRILCIESAWFSANSKILVMVVGSLLDLPGSGEGLVPLHQNRVFSKHQRSRKWAWFCIQSLLSCLLALRNTSLEQG